MTKIGNRESVLLVFTCRSAMRATCKPSPFL